MTKLTLLGAAVIVVTYTSSPAAAQHRAVPAVNPYTAGDWCPGREPGNPYTKEEDYLGWSGWRARGGWDDRNDFNCVPARIRYHAYGFAPY